MQSEQASIPIDAHAGLPSSPQGSDRPRVSTRGQQVQMLEKLKRQESTRDFVVFDMGQFRLQKPHDYVVHIYQVQTRHQR
jgi:hypothetical protein